MSDKNIFEIIYEKGEMNYQKGRIEPFWKEESKTDSGGITLGGTSSLWYRQTNEIGTVEINSKYVIRIEYWGEE